MARNVDKHISFTPPMLDLAERLMAQVGAKTLTAVLNAALAALDEKLNGTRDEGETRRLLNALSADVQMMRAELAQLTRKKAA